MRSAVPVHLPISSGSATSTGGGVLTQLSYGSEDAAAARRREARGLAAETTAAPQTASTIRDSTDRV